MEDSEEPLGYNECQELAAKADISDKTFRKYGNTMVEKGLITRIEFKKPRERVLHTILE